MAFDFLTDRQREVYTLHKEQGMTFTAIGEELGISKTGASAHYRLAERRIREFDRYKNQRDMDEDTKYTVELTRADVKVLLNALSEVESYDVRRLLEKKYDMSNKRFNSLSFFYEMTRKLSEKLHDIAYPKKDKE